MGEEGELGTYEEEVLVRMYDRRVIGTAYVPIERLKKIVDWDDLQRTYGIRKGFERVMRRLHSKGYIDFHGKSGDVASLTPLGTAYARGRKLP